MIRRFIKYYKPHIPMFSLDTVAALIVAICNLHEYVMTPDEATSTL